MIMTHSSIMPYIHVRLTRVTSTGNWCWKTGQSDMTFRNVLRFFTAAKNNVCKIKPESH